jgi:hypothetical protein
LPLFESEEQARLFSEELDFWGIETFDEQEDKKLVSKFPKSLIEIFNEPPKNVSSELSSIWNEIGPLNLAELYRQCTNDTLGINMALDFDLKFCQHGQTKKGNTFEG